METQLARAIGSQTTIRRSQLAASRNVREGRSHLVMHTQPSPGRSRIEALIAREFKTHFDADVREFMPTLVGLYDKPGCLKAAVGCRAASTEPLFLESYTNGPIEQLLRVQTGCDVARERIVEVGSLACSSGRAAMEIVTALVPALIEAGFSWVVFTGADTVRNVFRRLDLKPVALCIANKQMLGDQQNAWGTYYDHNPVVMAGRLADGVAALDPIGGVN
ncbi:MAG: thermostable hemolysin [Gammaproteobacteria bacterium]|jgi:hypothetical protein